MKSTDTYVYMVNYNLEQLRVEARGAFRCPRMIDCNSVCQGFPSCCVNGQCFCQTCRSLPPPLPPAAAEPAARN